MDKEMKEICDYLKDKGFECVSQKDYHVQIYHKGYLVVNITDKKHDS